MDAQWPNLYCGVPMPKKKPVSRSRLPTDRISQELEVPLSRSRGPYLTSLPVRPFSIRFMVTADERDGYVECARLEQWTLSEWIRRHLNHAMGISDVRRGMIVIAPQTKEPPVSIRTNESTLVQEFLALGWKRFDWPPTPERWTTTMRSPNDSIRISFRARSLFYSIEPHPPLAARFGHPPYNERLRLPAHRTAALLIQWIENNGNAKGIVP